ncbi:hypothetical protein [Bradyrhizobium embrapense]
MLPIGLAGELVSIGTLVLRVRDPDLPRPFKAPVNWLAAPAAAGTSLFLLLGLPLDTWIRLVIYAACGRRHSRLRARGAGNTRL